MTNIFLGTFTISHIENSTGDFTKKSPLLALCLLIIHGLGHLYTRGLFGGALRFCFFWILLIFGIVFGVIWVSLIWIRCALDAAGQAVKGNKGL